jgi:muramoyltetrapeptide carboxypeptidase
MHAQFEPAGRRNPVGVVAMSGPVDSARLQAGLEVLRGWAHTVLEAPNLADRDGYLAGSDERRLEGLNWVLDRGARTIVAARGGFGVTRLLHRLPWDRMIEDHVLWVGYSDLTAVLGPLALRGASVQVHGPMVAAGLADPVAAGRLFELLEGRLVGARLFGFDRSCVVREGQAAGWSYATNLSLLVSLVGTPWEPDLEGAVVFLEEVAEPLYRLDRMLTHLRASGIFSGVKALISGSLHDCPEIGDDPGRWPELLLDAGPDGVPVVIDLPFGHGPVNLAFPIGAPVEVDTRSGRIDWSG